MRTIRTSSMYIVTLLFILLLSLAGCGGGGGGGGSSSSSTKTKTSLKTSSLLGNAGVYKGIDLILTFPYGITVPIDPATNQPATSVVKLVGATDPEMVLSSVTCTQATPASRGSLHFVLIDLNGFLSNGNEYIELELDISTPGFVPVSADFDFPLFEVSTGAGVVTSPPKPIPSVETY